MSYIFRNNEHIGEPGNKGPFWGSGFCETGGGLIYTAEVGGIKIRFIQPLKTDAGAADLTAMARAAMAPRVNASMRKADLERIARGLHLDPRGKNKGQIVALIKGA